MDASPALQIGSNSKPVLSAEKVAAVRALGAKDPMARNPDDLASYFLGRKYRTLVWALSRSRRVGRWILEKKSPGAYWYLQARTKHIDRSFEAALQDGFQQIVILGAGYDTRPYRFRSRMDGVRVFEVDVGPTQQRKKDCLESVFSMLPCHVTFVPTDFNRDSLPEVLGAAGHDPGKRTFYIWEGVIYYLPEESVRSILDALRKNSAPGSRLVFDYILKDGLAGDPGLYGAREAMKLWKDMGEPGRFGFENAEAARRYLDGLGFAVHSDIDSREMEKRYGLPDQHGQVGRIVECMRFLDAELR